MAKANTITISGSDPFSHPLSGITYLGMEWVLNPIVRTDICVSELLASIGGNSFPDRRDELVDVLDIDTSWHMHAVSDGERRRVQLAMGLIRPWTVLLLDEVTVDLDVLARARFLGFLKKETETRGCMVVYATHILESAQSWATHLVRVSLGRVKRFGETRELLEEEAEKKGKDKGEIGLLEAVLGWLEEDLKERGPRNVVPSEHVAYQDLDKIE
jgi:CCR4-NOT complex subunit CAF16